MAGSNGAREVPLGLRKDFAKRDFCTAWLFWLLLEPQSQRNFDGERISVGRGGRARRHFARNENRILDYSIAQDEIALQ